MSKSPQQKKMKHIYGKSGVWYRVSNYESCCDCGLCHYKEYKVVVDKSITNQTKQLKIYFRAWRDEEKTKINRTTPKK
jgi:hypothetical protein